MIQDSEVLVVQVKYKAGRLCFNTTLSTQEILGTR